MVSVGSLLLSLFWGGYMLCHVDVLQISTSTMVENGWIINYCCLLSGTHTSILAPT